MNEINRKILVLVLIFFEKIKNKAYEDAKNISGEKYNMPNSCVITILNKFDIFSERNAVKPLLLAKYPEAIFSVP